MEYQICELPHEEHHWLMVGGNNILFYPDEYQKFSPTLGMLRLMASIQQKFPIAPSLIRFCTAESGNGDKKNELVQKLERWNTHLEERSDEQKRQAVIEEIIQCLSWLMYSEPEDRLEYQNAIRRALPRFLKEIEEIDPYYLEGIINEETGIDLI